MERLKYWFGGRHPTRQFPSTTENSDTAPGQQEETKNLNNNQKSDSSVNQDETNVNTGKLVVSKTSDQNTTQTIPEDGKTLAADKMQNLSKVVNQTKIVDKELQSITEKVVEWVDSRAREVVPLQEGDCLNCKIVGTTTFLFISGILIRSGHYRSTGLVGRQRFFNLLHFYLAASAFGMLAYYRWFDMYIYEKPKEGEKKKTIMEHLKGDIDKTILITNKIKARIISSEGSDNKDDKK